MKTVKIYMAGTKPIHLASHDEHFLNKGKHALQAHCGAQDTAEMTLGELPVEDLKLTCEACNYQASLLQQLKG